MSDQDNEFGNVAAYDDDEDDLRDEDEDEELDDDDAIGTGTDLDEDDLDESDDSSEELRGNNNAASSGLAPPIPGAPSGRAGQGRYRDELSPAPTSVASTMTPDQASAVGINQQVGGKVLRLGDDDDSDEEEDEDEDDDRDDSRSLTPPPNVINAAPVSRGKVLRKDINLDAMDTDDDGDDNDNGGQAEVAATVGEPVPVAAAAGTADVTPNGQPAAAAAKAAAAGGDQSDSSEDVPIAQTRKKKKKAAKKAASAKKKTKKQPGPSKAKKRAAKASAAVDGDDTDDDEEVVAAVVVDGEMSDADDGEVVAAAVVVEDAPKKKRKKPGPKPKKKPGPKPGSAKKKPGPKPGWKKNKASTPASGKKAGRKRKRQIIALSDGGELDSSDGDDNSMAWSEADLGLDGTAVPIEAMEAALAARDLLVNTVDRLPLAVSDSHSVRNLGRIKVEPRTDLAPEEGGGGALYSSASAIHPVGFSCDRYEFSPVHGRLVRLRCDILDGAKVRAIRQKDAAKRKAKEGKEKAVKAEVVKDADKGGKKAAKQEDGAAAAPTNGIGAPDISTAATASGAKFGNGDGTPPGGDEKKDDDGGAGEQQAAEKKTEPQDHEVATAPASTGESKENSAIQEREKKKGDLTPPPSAAQSLADGEDYDGPIFRVMWGKGIEETSGNDYSFPFDVYSASVPLAAGGDNGVDAVAVPLDKTHKSGGVKPEAGMRVSVRFDQDQWYGGTISKVKKEAGADSGKAAASPGGKKVKKGEKKYKIRIDYDDGMQEEAMYPDPEILLRAPGSDAPGLEGGVVDVTEIKGRPVTTVTGRTPLDAWGKTLISLGLIDEIMYREALEALACAREEGMAEAKEKMELMKKQRQEARAKYNQRLKQGKEGAEGGVIKEGTEEEGDNKKDENAEDGGKPKEEQPAEGTKDEEAAKAGANEGDAGISSASVTAGEAKEGKAVDGTATDEVKKDAPEADSIKEEAGTTNIAEKESSTEEEDKLRTRVEALREQLSSAQLESHAVTTALSDARVAVLGPFFSNPFSEQDGSLPQQQSWLSTIVRKEKSKMGSTGNKRKIVTATDLLERNDTFFNPDIERLVEGLPGSEFCPGYVFHAHRAGGAAGASLSWIHEAQIRHEKDQQRKAKASKEAKAKASKLKERELKRKKRDEERDARKKQKLEEEEQKKLVREEERLSRLGVQVDDRLFKEACFQREKVVLSVAKALGKEFTRRRNAAKMVAAGAVGSSTKTLRNKISMVEAYQHCLPPLSRQYDKDIVRIWDFIWSFEDAFKETGDLSSLPSLDSLQDAILSIDSVSTCTKGVDEATRKQTQKEALHLLTNLAITLCKPLASSLLKTLSSVVTAAGTSEKDTMNSASFDSSTSANGGDGLDALPVTDLTWREVARLSLVGDALGELGCNKQEVAHLLRGFRSGGHPNSKEARRLRRGEDFAVCVLRQTVAENAEIASDIASEKSKVQSGITVKITAPCPPSDTPSDWTFFLHNVKSLKPNAATAIKSNIRKALALLKEASFAEDAEKGTKESIISELERNLAVFDNIASFSDSSDTMSACKKARHHVLKILDKVTNETFSKDKLGHVAYRDIPQRGENDDGASAKPPVHKAGRLRMGLATSLFLSQDEYKKRLHVRETYVEDAEKLKEELDRKQKRESKEAGDEEDDDDEDDDEDEDEEGAEDNNEDKKSASGENNTEEKKTSANNGNESAESAEEKKVPSSDGNSSANIESAEAPSEAVAIVVEGSGDGAEGDADDGRIGKKTPYDDFCGDNPSFPDLIRRCLAVLRTICISNPAEPFIFPVDAQSNPKYYETILRPISLYDIGQILQAAGKRFAVEKPEMNGDAKPESAPLAADSINDEERIEAIVAEFARNVRHIALNCSCYSNAGNAIISSADEMMRIFERLFFDWVLAPADILPPLESLDDDKCVDPHPSDEDALVLLCDGCDGKFNMGRLDPPLKKVPKGDWYCPRCLTGRNWAKVDPRIGRKIQRTPTETCGSAESGPKMYSGKISRCIFTRPEDGTRSLTYVVKYDIDGDEETLTLEEVDKALEAAGNPAPPIQCLEAVSESPGYGGVRGPDQGLLFELLPALIDPKISDAAAQASLSNSVFRDTIMACANLALINTDEMTSSEWLRLLEVLVTKCASSDELLDLASELENQAMEQMAEQAAETGKIKSFHELLPKVTDDEAEGTGSDEEGAMGKKDGDRTNKKGRNGETKKKEILFGDESSEEEDEEEEWNDDSAVKGKSKSKSVKADIVEVAPVAKAEPLKSDNGGRVTPSSAVADVVISEEDLRKKSLAKAKSDRQKAKEDCFVASAVKQMMKPTVASFEEDTFTQVVDTALKPKDENISLASCRCRGVVCDFCGLPDGALGLPLIRAPNQKEWLATIQHSASNRASHMIAVIDTAKASEAMQDKDEEMVDVANDAGEKLGSADACPETTGSSEVKQENKGSAESKSAKRVAVRVRVNGELVSEKLDSDDDDGLPERGMLEFLPRNPEGFQHELRCRKEDNSPFITGSLSAHECCAVAAHKARKDAMIQQHRDLASTHAEKDAAATCGRTLPLGFDKLGRAYVRFHSDPTSLFIMENGDCSESSKKWHRFSKPEAIACIIACLREEDPVDEVKKRYPEAAEMAQKREWANVLQKRRFTVDPSKFSDDDASESDGAVVARVPIVVPEKNGKNDKGDDAAVEESSKPPPAEGAATIDPQEVPYVEGEGVLVESASGKLLWDAIVIAVSKNRDNDKVNGYRVHYKEWSSRFDEWVDPLRVVEPSEHNLLCQAELLEEFFASRDRSSVPDALEKMTARSFVNSQKRARGDAPLPKFNDVLAVGPGASVEDEAVAKLKAGLLLIEAALPSGAVDTSKDGAWRPEAASQWRSMVEKADGPASLMGCVILLEDALSAEFLYPQALHLLSCLQRHWKAVSEASYSSIALRISVIDMGVKWDTLAQRKSKRKT